MIILLNGKPGVGKNSFFKIVRKNYPHDGASTLAFADPLYEYVKLLTGKDFKDIPDRLLHIDDVNIRGFLRDIARVSTQYFGKSIFAEYVRREVPIHARYLIITDFRFIEQYEHLRKSFKEMPIVTVHIERPTEKIYPVEYKEFLKSPMQEWEKFLILNHPKIYATQYSSIEYPPKIDFEFTIKNDGTYSDYEQKVIKLWKTIRKI